MKQPLDVPSKMWSCLEAIIRPYFRRTTKAGLGSELVLPAQIHENVAVEFNEMERYIYENYQRKMDDYVSSDEYRKRHHLESTLMLCSTPFYEKTVERQHNFQQTSATVKVQGSVRQVLEKLFRSAISENASLDRESCEIQIRQGVVLELQKKFDEALVIYERLGAYSERKSESPLESPIEKDQMEEDMQEMLNDQIRYWRHIHHKAGNMIKLL